ncbi:sigma factor-like helix-turn-helix DNA-binding protein [Eubacteriales bacterium KG125]
MLLDKATELRKLEEKAKRLESNIENAEPVEVTDFYKDYKTGYPKVKILCGVGYDVNGIKHQKRQLERLQRQIDRIKGHMRSELDLIKDPDTKEILEYYLLEGLSYRQIAKRLFISKSTVERKVKQFFMKKSSNL